MSDLNSIIRPDENVVFVVEYHIQTNTIVHTLGLFTDLKVLTEAIRRCDPNPIYWKYNQSDSYRRYDIYGFYHPRFMGTVVWSIFGYVVNDTHGIDKYQVWYRA